MASIGPTSTRGGRKSLDPEINLVPFIDLLSMCICFLLMTAIWVEVGSIQIKQILGTAAPAVTKESLDLQVKTLPDKSFMVQLEKGGKVVQSININGDGEKQKLSRFSQYIGQLAGAVNAGAGTDITARVIPSFLNYAQLIAVLDILRGYGITNLAVVPSKE